MKILLVCFLALSVQANDIEEKNAQKRGIEDLLYSPGGSGVYLGHEGISYSPISHGFGGHLNGGLIGFRSLIGHGSLISPGGYGYGGISSGTDLIGTGLNGLAGGVGGGTGVGGDANGQVQISTIIQQVPVAVPQPVPVTVNRAVPVPVAAPYPVTVSRPVPVPFPQPIPVQVIKRVPVIVNRPVPIPVPQPVPVPVRQPYIVPVPQAVPVQVPQSVAVPVAQPVTVQVPVPVVVSSDNNGESAGFGGVAGISGGLLQGVTGISGSAANNNIFGESGGLGIQFGVLGNTGHISSGSHGKY